MKNRCILRDCCTDVSNSCNDFIRFSQFRQDTQVLQIFVFMQPGIPARVALLTLLLVVSGNDVQLYGIKLAVNNHLLVSYKTVSVSGSTSLQYQCVAHLDQPQYTLDNVKDVYSISIGKLQNEAQLYFVAAGMQNFLPYMSKISVNCDNSQVGMETVFFNESQYSTGRDHFIVNIDPHGKFAVGYTSSSALLYDLVSLKHWSTKVSWPGSKVFSPTAVDITARFLYVVGYSPQENNDHVRGQIPYFKTNLYLMSIDYNSSKYDIKFHHSWTSDILVSYWPDVLFISVSANDTKVDGKILIGIPPANTIHLLFVDYAAPIRLQHISSKKQYGLGERRGYGTKVAWLNQGRSVVILDTDFRGQKYRWDSKLHYYDISNEWPIFDTTTTLSIFPNTQQNYPAKFTGNFLFIAASFSIPATLYGYNTNEQVLVLPPSQSGYYSVRYQSLEETDLKRNEQIFLYTPNSAQCRPGTYKNDAGVWSCRLCNSVVTKSTALQYHSNNSDTFRCHQCTNRAACPLEFVTEVDHLPDIKQNSGYPESPETDVFDDILMLEMFQANWNFTSPFLVLMIVLSIVVIIAGLTTLLKLSKQFASKQPLLMQVFQHLDLIGQGQLWFGGLISIVLLFIVAFAAKFGHSYHDRYPIEKQICNNTDSCVFGNLYNAKFDTSLQFLSSSTDQYDQIFSLLNSQKFKLNIELIDTISHCGRLTLKSEESIDFLPFSCFTSNRILYTSLELAMHNLNLKLVLASNDTIGAIRIGLAGPDAYLTDNHVQKLNFAKTFYQVDQILSQNPVINLQLTKVINITEALTINDQTTYTGLWLPTFIFDMNQLFSSLESPKNRGKTTLSLAISETAFFVKNKQKPIARKSEIIFHTILFIGVCIDLISMILLLLRLWIIPNISYVVHSLFRPSSLVYRLTCDKQSSSETLGFIEKLDALEIQIKKTHRQYETMSERVDALMELLLHLQRTIEQQIRPTNE